MTYLFLTPVLVVGAVADLKFRKVPNGVICFGVVTGLGIVTVARLLGDGGAVEPAFPGHAWSEIWRWLSASGGYLLRLGMVCVLFFPLFLFRMMGAGDVKLMAVVTAWLGWRGGVMVIGYSFFIGAVWALLKLCLSGIFWQRISYFIAYIRRLFLTKEKTPYYLAERDGDQVVIPFAVCLLGGFLVFLMLETGGNGSQWIQW